MAAKPSDFITKGNFIENVTIPAAQERWKWAIQEAINQQKTADNKASIRMDMIKLLKEEIKLYEEQEAKLRESYQKAVQSGTEQAWKMQRDRELAQFKQDADIRIHNSSELGRSSRASTRDKAIAGKLQTEKTYEEHKESVKQHQTVWDRVTENQGLNGVGDAVDNAVQDFISKNDNRSPNAPGNDGRLRYAVRQLYGMDKIGDAEAGDPHELFIEKIYQQIPDKETRDKALDIVYEELKSLDTEGPTVGAGGGLSEKFQERAALRDSFGWTKSDFEAASVGGSGTPKAYLVGREEFKPSTELGEAEQAMLEQTSPSSIDDYVAEYERLKAQTQAEIAKETAAIRDYLGNNRLATDVARDIYHTRFGTQKARPQVLLDELGRFTPAELEEAKALARARRAEIDAEQRAALTPPPTPEATAFKPSFPSPVTPELPFGLPAPPAGGTADDVPVGPEFETLPVEPQPRAPQKPKQQRPPIIKPGTVFPGGPDTHAQPKDPVGMKAPSAQELQQNTGTVAMRAMQRGNILASQQKKMDRILKTDPIAKNVATAFSIDQKNKIPMKEQMDKLIKAYEGRPAEQAKALEILFAIRTRNNNSNLIQEVPDEAEV